MKSIKLNDFEINNYNTYIKFRHAVQLDLNYYS